MAGARSDVVKRWWVLVTTIASEVVATLSLIGSVFAAIVFETIATLALRVAAMGRPCLYAAVAAGYVMSFALLSVALDHGLGLGATMG